MVDLKQYPQCVGLVQQSAAFNLTHVIAACYYWLLESVYSSGFHDLLMPSQFILSSSYLATQLLFFIGFTKHLNTDKYQYYPYQQSQANSKKVTRCPATRKGANNASNQNKGAATVESKLPLIP